MPGGGRAQCLGSFHSSAILGAPAPPACQHKGYLEMCSLTQLPASAFIQLWHIKCRGETFQGQSHFWQNWQVSIKAHMPIALHEAVMSYHQITWSPSHSFAYFFPLPLPCERIFLLRILSRLWLKWPCLLQPCPRHLLKSNNRNQQKIQQLQKEHQRLIVVSHHDFYILMSYIMISYILICGLSYSLLNSVSPYSGISKAGSRWDVCSNKFWRGWRCALRVWFSLTAFLA